MDDYSRPRRKRDSSRARERHMARKRRQETIFSIKNVSASRLNDVPLPKGIPSVFGKIRIMIRDLIWHLFSRAPVFKILGVLMIALALIFVANYVFASRIFPNVWSMDIPLGDMTIEEAATRLQNEWDNNLMINLTIDGQTIGTLSPEDFGLSLDALETAHAARNVGMTGIPFGAKVQPIIQSSYSIAQAYLLELTEDVYVQPYEAGYTWDKGTLVPINGRTGKQLDISLTLERYIQDPISIVENRRFELLTTALLPTVMDASPFLDEAFAFLNSNITLEGFDPYLGKIVIWTVNQDEATKWLATGVNGLTVREDAFRLYIQGINQELVNSETPRYLDERDSYAKIQEALRLNNPQVIVRIRYLPQSYEVVAGDTGYLIGRKQGIPTQLITDANPAVDWNVMSIGQTIQIPSRDVLLPQDPLPNKRIIVDLTTQWLVAYENDEIVFSWGISSGRDTAPTYPGVFQILTHNDTAYGSSFALCGDGGTDCGQWEMYWFMGVYEVVPGLMNGFHGAVLLPNGGYLGGGGVSYPSTYGCIMSLDANANRLYDWAEIGTIVEILSPDFAPESELGQRALEYIATIDTSYRPTTA